MEKSLETIYRDAEQLAETHYENFPVISVFTPRRLRKHIAVIYSYARGADDIADEGDLSDEERITGLSAYEDKIRRIKSGTTINSYELALKNTIDEFNIPHYLFTDLISAFKQDVVKKEYSSQEELYDYSRRSANPIGRLILILHGYNKPYLLELSDSICSALQFINFLQDVSVDRNKGRCYLPADVLNRFNLTAETVFATESRKQSTELIRFLVERYRKLLFSGAELEQHLHGLLKYQIRWTILGGNEILSKIEKIKYNVFEKRVSLSKINFVSLLFESLFYARRKYQDNSEKE